MMTFKCKMCGGDLNFERGARITECPYCGTTQTLPKLDNDRRANLYDRANHFRRQNEYDKAAAIYEQILAEDRIDAEAYWSLVLCKYGIEYVEDPVTHKRVPTVNRVQYASFLADEDYKSAIRYADAAQRLVYEAEANTIAEIQKGILDISKKEEPFDVFICYKETDDSGKRIKDSVLAQDIYFHLVNEGYKVFFSRITLEDKLGQQYEPYIFAALNSAKVMLVVGTKPEYFRAVWVKNEWSRFLALAKQDRSRVIIPCYRDMDPYDLPEELSLFQSQDMSKIGFIQDVVRGIQKIIKDSGVAEKVNVSEKSTDNKIESDTLDKLEQLQRLYEQGVLDEITYTQQKEKMIKTLRGISGQFKKPVTRLSAKKDESDTDKASEEFSGSPGPKAQIKPTEINIDANRYEKDKRGIEQNNSVVATNDFSKLIEYSEKENRKYEPNLVSESAKKETKEASGKPIKKRRQFGTIVSLLLVIIELVMGVMKNDNDTWDSVPYILIIAGLILVISAILSGRKKTIEKAPIISLVGSFVFIGIAIILPNILPSTSDVLDSRRLRENCEGCSIVLIFFGIVAMIFSLIANAWKKWRRKKEIS